MNGDVPRLLQGFLQYMNKPENFVKLVQAAQLGDRTFNEILNELGELSDFLGHEAGLKVTTGWFKDGISQEYLERQGLIIKVTRGFEGFNLGDISAKILVYGIPLYQQQLQE